MTKISNAKAVIALIALGCVATACCDDDDNNVLPTEPRYAYITFEETGITLAGPTSYGANLYAGYEGQFTSGEVPVDGDIKMRFGLNVSKWDNKTELSAGGMVLSQWNYRSQGSNTNPTWWREFINQCSVYNVKSVDGANTGAGADGSNTFAVIFGEWGAMGDGATISLTGDAELRFESVKVCLTSYVYGNLAISNVYGNHPDKNMEQAKGWFKVLARGFDAQGNPTNGGEPVEFYLCDYRDTTNPQIPYVTEWTTWYLGDLGLVNKIEFDFKGSDTSEWGLNTPAYAALDNFGIKLPDFPD